MPEEYLFARGLCRTEQRYNHAVLADFFDFARAEFSSWLREIRSIVAEHAPDMMVVMGRDETLRIPAQQDEMANGNIDMVCWHQWHYNGALFYEYLLNRVRGEVCVAQELGVYRFDDIAGGRRHTDADTAAMLEKKLMCSHGNFVQWQVYDDPYMVEISENALGLYRADKSLTDSAIVTRKIVQAENSMKDWVYGRDDDAVKIMTVYGTSYYFSADSFLAQSGIRNHIDVLYRELHEQTNLVPEHLLDYDRKAMNGNPSLIILPSMQTLSRKAWNEALKFAERGAVILLCGCIERGELFTADEKLCRFNGELYLSNLSDFEELSLNGKKYSLDFRQATNYADAANLLCRCSYPDGADVRLYPYHKGTIIHCALPVELSSNREAIAALYQYAITLARADNRIYRVHSCPLSILFTATKYEKCTIYTLINDGDSSDVCWEDLRSDTKWHIHVAKKRSCKLWIAEDGQLIGRYGEFTTSGRKC